MIPDHVVTIAVKVPQQQPPAIPGGRTDEAATRDEVLAAFRQHHGSRRGNSALNSTVELMS